MAMNDLFQQVARAQDDALEDGATLDNVRRTLLARPAARSRRPLVAGLVLTAAAGALVFWLRDPPPLTFEVARTPGTEGTTVVARADSELPLQFSDGSAVVFQPGASGQVRRLGGSGADVVLDRGRLEVHVVHASQTKWTVRAGPFRIRVTGTRFSTTWDPKSRIFKVALQEGAVLIDGALLGEAMPLRAGQVLNVDVPAAVVQTEPLVTAPPVERPPPPAARQSRAEKPAPAPPPRPAWRALAEKGAHAQALLAAEAMGFTDLCQQIDARALLILGDAARYAGATPRARQAFEALVRRFGDDALAADAVFSLGRLAVEAGERADAIRWFGMHATRWPDGALAEQAAGRLLELHAGGSDGEAARRAAELYLQRHPDGPRASLARRTLVER